MIPDTHPTTDPRSNSSKGLVVVDNRPAGAHQSTFWVCELNRPGRAVFRFIAQADVARVLFCDEPNSARLVIRTAHDEAERAVLEVWATCFRSDATARTRAFRRANRFDHLPWVRRELTGARSQARPLVQTRTFGAPTVSTAGRFGQAAALALEEASHG